MEYAFIKHCFDHPVFWSAGFRPTEPLAVFILDEVKAYRDEYDKYPNFRTFMEYLGTRMDAQELELVEDHLNTDIDQKFAKNEILRSLETQSLKSAAHEALDLLEEGDVKGARSAMTTISSVYYQPSYKYFEDRRDFASHSAIPTGYVSLDRPLSGGMQRRKLGIVMGPRSAGKSMVLLNLAVGAMYFGFKVFYATFEDSLETLVGRFDQRLSGYGELPINRVKKMYGGDLHVQEFMTKQHTVADIDSALDFQPDLIIVDYIDVVRASRDYRDARRHEIEDVTGGLRALSQKRDCAVWTAKQTGKSTKHSSETVEAEDSFESYAPAQIADVVLTINQTLEEKQAEKMRLILSKCKYGPDGITARFDAIYNRMLLRVPKG